MSKRPSDCTGWPSASVLPTAAPLADWGPLKCCAPFPIPSLGHIRTKATLLCQVSPNVNYQLRLIGSCEPRSPHQPCIANFFEISPLACLFWNNCFHPHTVAIMAAPVLPSQDNFMGVALVINRSRDGPRLVFHYPRRKVLPAGVPEVVEGEEDLDDDDDRYGWPEAGASSVMHGAEMAPWNYDDHIFTESGTQLVPWEYVAGYPTKDLENLLTPNRAYHKRLFQVSLDNIYCVSYPIYVPENGMWQKKKRKKKQEQEQHQAESGPGAKEGDALPTETDTGFRSGDRVARDGGSLGAGDAEGKEKAEKEKKASMTMFNLVFFLRPKKHEAKDLVDIMYTNIIKKINKAYKYCQERSDFVWKESKKILTLKDKGREESR